MQRAEKLLENAQVKLSSMISDIFGVSGRQMLQAPIDGQRDPKVLADMARGEIPMLEEALRGFFTDHHAVLLRIMLADIDRLSEQAALLDAEMNRFPTAAHLVSCAKFCPQTHESAGRKKGKGNRWLAGRHARPDRLLLQQERQPSSASVIAASPAAAANAEPSSPPETRCSPSSTSYSPIPRPTSTTWAPTTTTPASTKTVALAAWPASFMP
ncbi:hypothetical protein ACIBI9_62760 [Nonomuraea sp. NPDC050451]|uniref:hypothetical protein n=1 Tax=Nonomuraea sp. NPDC050451 TaxID=3364364 RepID=UPI003797BB1C